MSDPTVSTGRAAVTKLHAHVVRIPLKTKIEHASHQRVESLNLIVEIHLTTGAIGFGESAPRDYVTGETIEQSVALLQQTDWRQLGPVTSFGEGVESIRAFQLPTAPGDDRRRVGNAARCAVELAYLDAIGKTYRVSLHDLLRYCPQQAAIHEPTDRCRYSGVLTSKSDRKETLSAIKQRLGGFADFKIKVGTAGQDDPRRLRKFRRLLGRRARLRIDANEAWSHDQAADRIAELAPVGILSCEQPIPHAQVQHLADLRKHIAVPIMLDESLCSRVDAERAIEHGWCDLFNLRLSKCGGLLPSFELAALAAQHGLGHQLGCQVGETGVLSAAGRHFATAVKGSRFLEGSYDHHLVRERLTVEDLTFEWRGFAPALTKPGLGVTVDPAALARVRQSTTVLWGEP